MMRIRNLVAGAASILALTGTVSSLGAIGCGSATDDNASGSAADTQDLTDGGDAGDAASPLCGNGKRDVGEQCDDGNTVNTDGCSATCTFEQTTRVNSVALQWTTDSFCAANAIGDSVGSEAQSQLTSALTSAVDDGSISLLFSFLNLTDLTGANATSFEVGGMTAKPVEISGYSGASDLDDWYTTDTTAINATTRLATAQLAGSLKKNVLTAGPGNLNMSLALGGPAVPVSFTSVHVTADTTAATTPTESAKGTSPGHLAKENVDPTLKTFAGLSNGGICGNITAASLAKVPVPAQLQSGEAACSQGYTSANSMLDVFVGGCNVLFFTIITPTQPDKSTLNTGAAAYTFSASNGTVVDSCADANGNAVAFKTCLADTAYSTYLTFTADRVIAK